jgi:hypothetical protein
MRPTNKPPVRGFCFWSLAPFLVAFIVLMPTLVPRRDTTAVISLVVIESLAVLVLLGLFNSDRFWWTWRCVGGLVFLVYLAYLSHMLIEGDELIGVSDRKSEASAFNALCGLVVFGLPGLWFALCGRLSLRSNGADEFTDNAQR